MHSSVTNFEMTLSHTPSYVRRLGTRQSSAFLPSVITVVSALAAADLVDVLDLLGVSGHHASAVHDI